MISVLLLTLSIIERQAYLDGFLDRHHQTAETLIELQMDYRFIGIQVAQLIWTTRVATSTYTVVPLEKLLEYFHLFPGISVFGGDVGSCGRGVTLQRERVHENMGPTMLDETPQQRVHSIL